MTTTLGQFWFNLLLLNLCIVVSYIQVKKNRTSNAPWWLMLVFCLFAFWDIDYFGMYYGFLNMIEYGEGSRDVLYPWFVKGSFGFYTVYRLYIWGIAELLLYKTVKLLGLNRNLTIYVMIMNFMLLFSYARASLGMCFYFYGLTFYAVSERKGKLLVMLICFLFAFFAHRSMLILVLLTPLFYVKLNSRRLLLFFIVFFVLLIPFARYYVHYSASMDVENTGDMMNSFYSSAQKYSLLVGSNSGRNNWKFELIIQLRNISIFLGTVICTLIILRRNRSVSVYMNRLIMLTIGILLTAVTFLIQNTFGSWIIGYRILYMAGIPIVLMLSYLYENGLCSWKTLHWVFLPSLLFQEGFMIGKIISLGVI